MRHADIITEIHISGTRRDYSYEERPRGAALENRPGNYVFLTSNGVIIYAGESKNVARRVEEHEDGRIGKKHCLNRQGASKVAVHYNGKDKAARMAEERDIRSQHNPVCNRQHE